MGTPEVAIQRTTQEVLSSPSFQVKRVPQAASLTVWHSVFGAVFPDEKFPVEYFRGQADGTKAMSRSLFLLGESDGVPVGIRWSIFNSDLGLAHTPYGGVLETHRRGGVYGRIIQESEAILRGEHGVNTITIECEDPQAVQKPDERSFAQKRIGIFQRQGYHFVDPQFVRYLRGGDYRQDPDYYTCVNDSFVFGFKPLSSDSPIEVRDSMVSKEGLRRLYMDFMQLETDEANREEMKERFAAVKRFNQQLDHYPFRFIPLIPPVFGTPSVPTQA